MQFRSILNRIFIVPFDCHFSRWEDIPKGPTANAWKVPWPFIILSLSVGFVFWVGASPIAVTVCVGLYFIRMFGITGVYHRYFSHRTYKTSRVMQFLLAVLGNSAVQRGPLWWAAHHRHHHNESDQLEDPHSPKLTGFWNSHILWWSRVRNIPVRFPLIKDFSKYPELMFLDRFDSLMAMLLGLSCYGLGAVLERFVPGLNTNGPQMLVWGFVVSTVVLFHGVATIDSLAHVFGSQRFATTDTSRNNFLLSLVTLGEGWHNNHHYYSNSVRQGFYWWEIDITFYLLKIMSWMGLIWDLKPVPERILKAGKLGYSPTQVPIPFVLDSEFDVPAISTVEIHKAKKMG